MGLHFVVQAQNSSPRYLL